MITLVPLCTMTLTLASAASAGTAPVGRRMITEITGATLSGRLTGTLAAGGNADWFTMTAGGLVLPDVRLAIRTDDRAVVLVRYSGRLRFMPGQQSVAFIAPVFETGDAEYLWLNEIQAVGKGALSADLSTAEYEIYELG
jgi:Protein of unknown function (DUF3237)